MTGDRWLGIDLGTSGIKAVVVDGDEHALASASRPLSTRRPHDGWNEQHPDDWWRAALECLDELAVDADLMGRVGGIGLSGQMLGPVLVDRRDRPLRHVPLWNDGRSLRECSELLASVPDIGRRTACTPDPGLVAPKLLWLARHEPDVLAATDCLLLPKDYLRLRLTGERCTEPSDAAGTMLMDVATGRWSETLCAAAGWDAARLPAVRASWEAAGALLPGLATRFGLPPGIPVAAGAGDNMACSLGAGAARPGDCAISIGTSGVVCTVDDRFRPLPERAFLTAAHAAPDAFLSMGVVMSATSGIDWLLGLTGHTIDSLSAGIDALHAAGGSRNAPICVTWFNGNRTPHDRPAARARFAGVGLSTDAATLGFSILEGVAFQLHECRLAQREAGIDAGEVALVGGGSRNALWCGMVATLLDRPVVRPRGADVAACLGAARLARVAAGAGEARDVLGRRPVADVVMEPDPRMRDPLLERFERYGELCRDER